jgi:foldase protein PrsA
MSAKKRPSNRPKPKGQRKRPANRHQRRSSSITPQRTPEQAPTLEASQPAALQQTGNAETTGAGAAKAERLKTAVRLIVSLKAGGVVVLSGALAFGLIMFGSGSGKTNVPAGAVAVVGGQAIPKSALETLLTQAHVRASSSRQTFPKTDSAAYKTLQDELVGYLVQNTEIELRSKELEVSVSRKEVDDYIAAMKKQSFAGNDKRFRTALAAQGLSLASLAEQTRLQMLSTKLYDKVTAHVTVSDQAVRSYYDTNSGRFVTQDSRDVRHILVKSKLLAGKLYDELQAGADFATLAIRYSTDSASAKQGGELTISKGQTVAAFDTAVFALRTGAFTKPVKAQDGWHLILALAPVRKGGTQPFTKVAGSIRSQIEEQRKQAVAQSWLKETTRRLCDAGKLVFQPAFKPSVDPCTAAATATAASPAGRSGIGAAGLAG